MRYAATAAGQATNIAVTGGARTTSRPDDTNTLPRFHSVMVSPVLKAEETSTNSMTGLSGDSHTSARLMLPAGPRIANFCFQAVRSYCVARILGFVEACSITRHLDVAMRSLDGAYAVNDKSACMAVQVHCRAVNTELRSTPLPGL